MWCGSANAFNRCMSRMCKVTRLAWIMHSKASENIWTKYISLLSRSASIAKLWTRRSVPFCCSISRITRWNGSRGINKFVVRCNFMISFIAGLNFLGRTCFRGCCFFGERKENTHSKLRCRYLLPFWMKSFRNTWKTNKLNNRANWHYFHEFIFIVFTFWRFGALDDGDDDDDGDVDVADADVESMCDGYLPKKSEIVDDAVVFDRWLDWDEWALDRFELFGRRRGIFTMQFKNKLRSLEWHTNQNVIITDWTSNLNWCGNYQHSVLSWFSWLDWMRSFYFVLTGFCLLFFLFVSFLPSQETSNKISVSQYGNA